MTTTNVPGLDASIQTTNEWLKELQEEGRFETRQQTYSVLRATLHALRDRLAADEAVHLAAELPLVLRGAYFEGWKVGKQEKYSDQEGFLQHLRERFGRSPMQPSDDELFSAATAVFRVLKRRINAGELEDVRSNMPQELRDMFS